MVSPYRCALAISGVPRGNATRPCLGGRTTRRAPEALYAAPILVAALPIYLMTVAAAEATDHRTYSWWGLRTHLWLHVGGALPAALRHLGESPERGRHQRQVPFLQRAALLPAVQ